jgi:hypothetical protein
MVAAELPNLSHGDNQHSKEGVHRCTPSTPENPSVSQTEAAEMLGVSRRSVARL